MMSASDQTVVASAIDLYLLPKSAVVLPKVAGEYIGGKDTPISEKTLERWRTNMKGPRFVNYGHRTVRYRISDLDTFIEQRSFKANCEVVD